MNGPGIRVAILSCISWSTRDDLLLRPFSGSSQDTHPDKLDVHKAGEGRTAGPILTVIRLQWTTRWERRTLLPASKEGRGGERGQDVSSGKGTGQQEGRRAGGRHRTAPASSLHPAQDRKGGFQSQPGDTRPEGGRNSQPEPNTSLLTK